MLIVYASKTGNTLRFVNKLGPLESLRITSGEERVEGPCVLVTYTSGFGQVPPEVARFAEANREHIRAVAAGGNRNWGRNFARAADVLSCRFGFPVLLKFELAGRSEDVERFLKGVRDLALS